MEPKDDEQGLVRVPIEGSNAVMELLPQHKAPAAAPHVVDTTPAVEGELPTSEAPEPTGRCTKCGKDVPASLIEQRDGVGPVHQVPRFPQSKGFRKELQTCGPVVTKWYYMVSATWRQGELSGFLNEGVTIPFPIEDFDQVGILERHLAKGIKATRTDAQTGAAILGEASGPAQVIVLWFNLLRME